MTFEFNSKPDDDYPADFHEYMHRRARKHLFEHGLFGAGGPKPEPYVDACSKGLCDSCVTKYRDELTTGTDLFEFMDSHRVGNEFICQAGGRHNEATVVCSLGHYSFRVASDD